MKKKIIFGIAILAIAAVAAFNVNLNMGQKSDMSLLALANVEALANDESDEEKWERYERPPHPDDVPGYNCIPYGNETC